MSQVHHSHPPGGVWGPIAINELFVWRGHRATGRVLPDHNLRIYREGNDLRSGCPLLD